MAMIGPSTDVGHVAESNAHLVDLSGCSFRGIDHHVLFDLSFCTVDGSDFSGVDLYSTLWFQVSARACDFSEAELSASPNDCDFRDSWFDGANLGYNGMGGRETWTGCDLRGARFAGADLCGTDLFACRGEGADFSGAFYDARTRFPKDVKGPPRGAHERPLPWFERDDRR